MAGSVHAFYPVETRLDTFTNYLARVFAPTLIGNVIGGVSFVARSTMGQVAAEIEGRE